MHSVKGPILTPTGAAITLQNIVYPTFVKDLRFTRSFFIIHVFWGVELCCWAGVSQHLECV
jgi:hypothetical protein